MKVFLFLAGAAVLTSLSLSSSGPPDQDDGCQFKLERESATPTLSGPEEIVSRVRVTDQSDSPTEITALDFEGSALFVMEYSHSEHLRCKIRLRNRSNQPVKDARVSFHILVGHGGGGTAGGPVNKLTTFKPAGLGPGEEAELLNFCGGGGGGGSGGDDNWRIAVMIDWVELENCYYSPSRRVRRDSDLPLHGRSLILRGSGV